MKELGSINLREKQSFESIKEDEHQQVCI